MPYFFLSTKIYNQPDLENYNIAKIKLLNQLIPDYDSLSTKLKWVQLIEQFKKSIQLEDQPNPRFSDFLENFKNKRLVTINSYFNLSLKQCLNYYENFFFLYMNEEKLYQLKPQEKKSLLKSIQETGQVCETGINGRFYTALQEHQKQEEWVANVLVKARCNHIHLLQAQYEANFTGPHSMSVHLYDILVGLANQNGFTIPVHEHITDIYGGHLNHTQINEFFQKHFFNHQRQYQREIPSLLLQDTLQGLVELVSTEGQGLHWQISELLSLPGEFTTKLAVFFRVRFRLPEQKVAELIELVGELSDDASSFILKSQNQVRAHLVQAIQNYLYREEYLLSLEDLQKDTQLKKHMILPSGVDFKAVMDLFDAIQNKNQSLIQKHAYIMPHFLHLLIEPVISDVSNYQLIPMFLRNDTRFIDAMLLEIKQALLQAISLQEEDRIKQLFDLIIQVTRGDRSYLDEFDTSIYYHDTFRTLLNKQHINDHLSEYRVSVYELPHILKTHSLIDIIDHHQKRFPFLNRNLSELKKFIYELRIGINYLEKHRVDDIEMKRRACEIEDFQYLNHPYAKKTAVTFLAKNKNILEAFVDYQQYQNSLERALSIIIHDLSHYSYILAKESIKALICLIVVIKILPLLSSLKSYYIWHLLLALLVVSLLAWLTKNMFLYSLADLIIKLITLDVELYFSCCYRLLLHIYQGFKTLLLFFGSILQIISMACNALIQKSIYTSDDLNSACENAIFRLESMDEPSADVKAAILKDIYQKIQKDELHCDKALLLEKPYTIEFQNKTYQMSFQNVARMRRTSKSEFSLETRGDVFSMFRPNTHSSHILNLATNKKFLALQ